MFGLVAIGGLIKIRAELGDGTLGLLIFCIVLPVIFIFLLGVVVHWRALPRHFIPLISVFGILYAFGLAWWWQRRVLGMAVTLISTVLMGYSALNVRYAPRHAKDDYKHAAELAEIELARGGRVWWVAEGQGALYYDLPVHDYSAPSGATDKPAVQIIFSADSAAKLSTQTPPTVVLLPQNRIHTIDKTL